MNCASLYSIGSRAEVGGHFHTLPVFFHVFFSAHDDAHLPTACTRESMCTAACQHFARHFRSLTDRPVVGSGGCRPRSQEVFGPDRFMTVYLLGGLSGNIMSFLCNPVLVCHALPLSRSLYLPQSPATLSLVRLLA